MEILKKTKWDMDLSKLWRMTIKLLKTTKISTQPLSKTAKATFHKFWMIQLKTHQVPTFQLINENLWPPPWTWKNLVSSTIWKLLTKCFLTTNRNLLLYQNLLIFCVRINRSNKISLNNLRLPLIKISPKKLALVNFSILWSSISKSKIKMAKS